MGCVPHPDNLCCEAGLAARPEFFGADIISQKHLVTYNTRRRIHQSFSSRQSYNRLEITPRSSIRPHIGGKSMFLFCCHPYTSENWVSSSWPKDGGEKNTRLHRQASRSVTRV